MNAEDRIIERNALAILHAYAMEYFAKTGMEAGDGRKEIRKKARDYKAACLRGSSDDHHAGIGCRV